MSRDKGTTGQAQNLATGRDGPGFFETVPSRPGTSRGTKLPSIFAHLCRFQRKISKKKFKKKKKKRVLLGSENIYQKKKKKKKKNKKKKKKKNNFF